MLELYPELVLKLRDLGIAFSDRRAVKVLKLLAASALLCGRDHAVPSDLWVLRYIWDREEQIEPLAAFVNGVLEQHPGEASSHPLAAVEAQPSAEDIARQLDEVDQELRRGKLTLSAAARLRDRVTDLADRAAWLADVKSRSFLLERTRKCLGEIG